MSASTDTVSIFGVCVNGVDKADLVQKIQEWVCQPGQRTVAFVNAYCLNVAYRDPQYRDIQNGAYLVYPDGHSVVWACRWLYNHRVPKFTSRVWLPVVCELALTHPWRVYFLGGRVGVVEKAAQMLTGMFPSVNIAGVTDVFFLNNSESTTLNEIKNLKPHIVFVGMGVPLQEKWCAIHREGISAPMVWSVGAMFDTLSRFEYPLPPRLDGLLVEWLWPLLMDLRGKWRRYMLGNPLFIWQVFKQKYSHG